MKLLTLISPLLFTFVALLLTAVESALFPHLGIPAVLTPDLNLTIIVFLASCNPGLRPILSAFGVSLAATLFASKPSLPLLLGPMLVYFIAGRLNRTMFLNHLVPQALCAGCGRALLTICESLGTGIGSCLLPATGEFLTTTLFAFPILLCLNSLRERFLPRPGSLFPAS